MTIAIIGAGFTGLSAAWELHKAGHTVEIFEANPFPGGLAAGFKEPEWEWSLEHHYHHIFTSDHDILGFLAEIGLSDTVVFKSVRTATRLDGQQYQLDSPLSLLQFPKLSLTDRIRTGLALAELKCNGNWKPYEDETAERWIIRHMGVESWRKIWQPLFHGKFGEYASEVNAAWFWSRIHVRSQQLGYFKGGFGQLETQIVEKLDQAGIKTHLNTPVTQLRKHAKGIELTVGQSKSKILAKSGKKVFDEAIVTLPNSLLTRLVPQLPKPFVHKISKLEGLAAVTLVLELKKPFFADGSYWMNINEKGWPFLAVVEHTNFMPSEHYNGSHLLYVGKYLKNTDKQYSMTDKELIKLYAPYLHQLSPNFEKTIKRSWAFRAPFAQPIARMGHSQNVPSFETPIEHLYWASMQHVYPWDRGTNYAVSLGGEVASLLTDNPNSFK